jgi:transcriptional regulator GlxA family with amidase domain
MPSIPQTPSTAPVGGPRGHARTLVAVLAFGGVQLLDLTGPVEVLTTANNHGARYDLRIVSASGEDVHTSSGVRVGVDGSVAELPRRLGTLIVPGSPDWRGAVGDPALISLVADLAGRARRTASVCAGAFLLAEAGLLRGRRAATHWQLADDLAHRYPDIQVEPDPLFVRDGTVITSAGITAGIDLTLALIEEDHGPELARAVAQFLVVFMARPGGQSQFSTRTGAPYPERGTVRAAMDAVSADPAGDHSLHTMARRAGVSSRHLGRLFRGELGTTPAQFVESVRLEAARALLESGDRSIDLIAERAGFGSAETMRRAFQYALGVSPSTYRARFRTTAAS